MVVESGHQHRMDGWSLPPKIDIPCYQRFRVGGRVYRMLSRKGQVTATPSVKLLSPTG
jgi:hypothetical protein